MRAVSHGRSHVSAGQHAMLARNASGRSVPCLPALVAFCSYHIASSHAEHFDHGACCSVDASLLQGPKHGTQHDIHL